jgi:hypothetical protein
VWPSGYGHRLSHERARVRSPGQASLTQASILSGSVKCIETSKQWVTAVEDCEGKACGRKMAGYRFIQPEAQTTTCLFPAVSTGDLKLTISMLRIAPNKSAALFFLTFSLKQFVSFYLPTSFTFSEMGRRLVKVARPSTYMYTCSHPHAKIAKLH